MGIKKDSMGKYDHSDIKVRDIVVPASPSYALRSGGSWYPFAICVANSPRLVLMSEEADMKWGVTLPEMPLRAIGVATDEQMKVVNARYQAERVAEQAQEVKAALASVPLVYRVEWTEYDFGQRPDGVSYAIDLQALRNRISDWESQGSRECFTRAGDITQALVTPELFEEIQKSKSGILTTPRLDHEGFLGIFKARQ